MTAPSNANTSGLEVSLAAVLARAICESEGKDWAALDNTREDVERWFRLGEVTAASAQARIAELEAELSQANANGASHWSRATAAEARADRLAKALKYARYHVVSSLHSDRQQALDQIDAALQQETQP